MSSSAKKIRIDSLSVATRDTTDKLIRYQLWSEARPKYKDSVHRSLQDIFNSFIWTEIFKPEEIPDADIISDINIPFDIIQIIID